MGPGPRSTSNYAARGVRGDPFSRVLKRDGARGIEKLWIRGTPRAGLTDA